MSQSQKWWGMGLSSLRDELKNKGLETHGSKPVLVRRLEVYEERLNALKSKSMPIQHKSPGKSDAQNMTPSDKVTSTANNSKESTATTTGKDAQTDKSESASGEHGAKTEEKPKDWWTLSMQELKNECSKRNLSFMGNKYTLVNRLKSYETQSTAQTQAQQPAASTAPPKPTATPQKTDVPKSPSVKPLLATPPAKPSQTTPKAGETATAKPSQTTPKAGETAPAKPTQTSTTPSPAKQGQEQPVQESPAMKAEFNRINGLSLAQLKIECVNKKLNISGTRMELLERLRQYIQQSLTSEMKKDASPAKPDSTKASQPAPTSKTAPIAVWSPVAPKTVSGQPPTAAPIQAAPVKRVVTSTVAVQTDKPEDPDKHQPLRQLYSNEEVQVAKKFSSKAPFWENTSGKLPDVFVEYYPVKEAEYRARSLLVYPLTIKDLTDLEFNKVRQTARSCQVNISDHKSLNRALKGSVELEFFTRKACQTAKETLQKWRKELKVEVLSQHPTMDAALAKVGMKPEKLDPTVNRLIFLNKLPMKLKEGSLAEKFNDAASICIAKDTLNVSKGYGFVEYSSSAAAQTAFNRNKNLFLEGVRIEVMLYPKVPANLEQDKLRLVLPDSERVKLSEKHHQITLDFNRAKSGPYNRDRSNDQSLLKEMGMLEEKLAVDAAIRKKLGFASLPEPTAFMSTEMRKAWQSGDFTSFKVDLGGIHKDWGQPKAKVDASKAQAEVKNDASGPTPAKVSKLENVPSTKLEGKMATSLAATLSQLKDSKDDEPRRKEASSPQQSRWGKPDSNQPPALLKQPAAMTSQSKGNLDQKNNWGQQRQQNKNQQNTWAQKQDNNSQNTWGQKHNQQNNMNEQKFNNDGRSNWNRGSNSQGNNAFGRNTSRFGDDKDSGFKSSDNKTSRFGDQSKRQPDLGLGDKLPMQFGRLPNKGQNYGEDQGNQFGKLSFNEESEDMDEGQFGKNPVGFGKNQNRQSEKQGWGRGKPQSLLGDNQQSNRSNFSFGRGRMGQNFEEHDDEPQKSFERGSFADNRSSGNTGNRMGLMDKPAIGRGKSNNGGGLKKDVYDQFYGGSDMSENTGIDMDSLPLAFGSTKKTDFGESGGRKFGRGGMQQAGSRFGRGQMDMDVDEEDSEGDRGQYGRAQNFRRGRGGQHSFGRGDNQQSFGTEGDQESFGHGDEQGSFGRGGGPNSFGRGCGKESFGRGQSFGHGGAQQSGGRGSGPQSFGRGQQSFGREDEQQSFGRGGGQQSFGSGDGPQAFGRGGRQQSFGRGNGPKSFGNKGRGQHLHEEEEDIFDDKLGEVVTEDPRNNSRSRFGQGANSGSFRQTGNMQRSGQFGANAGQGRFNDDNEDDMQFSGQQQGFNQKSSFGNIGRNKALGDESQRFNRFGQNKQNFDQNKQKSGFGQMSTYDNEDDERFGQESNERSFGENRFSQGQAGNRAQAGRFGREQQRPSRFDQGGQRGQLSEDQGEDVGQDMGFGSQNRAFQRQSADHHQGRSSLETTGQDDFRRTPGAGARGNQGKQFANPLDTPKSQFGSAGGMDQDNANRFGQTQDFGGSFGRQQTGISTQSKDAPPPLMGRKAPTPTRESTSQMSAPDSSSQRNQAGQTGKSELTADPSMPPPPPQQPAPPPPQYPEYDQKAYEEYYKQYGYDFSQGGYDYSQYPYAGYGQPGVGDWSQGYWGYPYNQPPPAGGKQPDGSQPQQPDKTGQWGGYSYGQPVTSESSTTAAKQPWGTPSTQAGADDTVNTELVKKLGPAVSTLRQQMQHDNKDKSGENTNTPTFVSNMASFSSKPQGYPAPYQGYH